MWLTDRSTANDFLGVDGPPDRSAADDFLGVDGPPDRWAAETFLESMDRQSGKQPTTFL